MKKEVKKEEFPSFYYFQSAPPGWSIFTDISPHFDPFFSILFCCLCSFASCTLVQYVSILFFLSIVYCFVNSNIVFLVSWCLLLLDLRIFTSIETSTSWFSVGTSASFSLLLMVLDQYSLCFNCLYYISFSKTVCYFMLY